MELRTVNPPLEWEGVLPQLRRVFWLGAFALVAIGLTFAMLNWVNRLSASWILESQTTGRLARESRNLVLDRQAAITGFLLSKQEVALAPEFAARAPLTAKLDSLVRLTNEHASQNDRAMGIRAAIERWQRAWVMPVLAPGRAGAAPNPTEENAGRELFASVRSAFTSFLAGEDRIFLRRIQLQGFLQRFTFAAIAAEILALLGILWWLSRRALALVRVLTEQQRQLEAQSLDLQQQAAVLEEQAVELEEQTDHANRTAAELRSTNENLEATITRLEATQNVASAAQSQHQEAQWLLDFVLNSSPVGFSLHDRHLRIVRVNSAMAAMNGLPAQAHTGKSIDEVSSDDVADAMEPVMKRVLTTGEPVLNVPISASGPEPAGERHFLCSFFPVKLSGGNTGVGAVVLETTQYRQLEEQLLQAQKMEAVGRLAGGVAHDFNNMLTAIKSYSELVISDMVPGSSQTADMHEIIKAADKATALTRQLLAFSRQQVLRPQKVDLNATVEGLRKMLKRLTAGSIEISCSLAPGLWSVTADPTELERVITNLVLNARDAMPDGGQLIVETSNVQIDEQYASTHADIAPGPYVLLAITDTGAGMSREVKERLFEPFFTTKEKGKGTGLGLSSAYGIVKQSGGFVWVYSEPGQGTTFKIYLPRAEEVEPRPATPSRNRRIGSETILFVEDDAEVRQVATRILRRNGYRVLEATNGADALRVCEAEREPVDLIVTDIVMPGMGGSELARRIRERQPDARILFTSGYTEDAVVRQSFLQQGEAFIEKPFTPALLTRKAREVLESQSGDPA